MKDFKLSPEFIEEFGFVSARAMNGYLTLRHKSGGLLSCEFEGKNLPAFKKKLEKAISANDHGIDFDGNSNPQKFVIKFIEILVHDAEYEYEAYKTQGKKERDEKQKIIVEIEQARKENASLTLEEWRSTLKQKYQNLHNVVQEKMPEIRPGLEFELSVQRVLNIEGCTLPFIGIILGRPSSYKTVILSLLKKWPYTFYTDNFTPRSFVSHSTSVNSLEKLAEIDLLPKIMGKLLLTPELSPMFTAKQEDLTHLLGIITRIADGHGYVSDSGAHGHRGYDEDIMFTWVGAAVDISPNVYKLLNNLGAKIYFFRTNFKDESIDQLMEYATTDQEFNDRFREVQDSLFDYLKWFEIGPKMKWDRSKDDLEALQYIVRLADLLSHLRCVEVHETHGTQGSDYAFSISQREVPRRAITALYNLARGHALLTGRNYIALDDIPIVLKTAIDTTQTERVSLFSLLLANGGKLTTSQIIESLNISKPTALKTMAELEVIGLVNIQKEGQGQGKEEGAGRPLKSMTLNPKFEWLLSDELIKKIFPHTKQNFSNTEENGNGQAKKEEAFWRTCYELEKEESSTHIREEDKYTISGGKLKERLLRTGEFYNGDVNDMIEYMVNAGRLEEIMPNTFRRIPPETVKK